MEPAYTHRDNTGMTATDTQKNTVYYVAKGLARPTAPERFAELLAEHFIQEYPLVSKAKVTVEQKAWDRAELPAGPHDHGFVKRGDAVRFARVELGRGASVGVLHAVPIPSPLVGHEQEDVWLRREAGVEQELAEHNGRLLEEENREG